MAPPSDTELRDCIANPREADDGDHPERDETAG